jgi:large conductance mechanosensitive channel
MGMMKEFKDFAMKGNVIDLAIGVVIGAAFGKIVDSAVNDILMPPIGALISGVDFKDMAFTIAGVNIKYGNFINNTIIFIITAFFLFMVIKAMNTMKKKEAAAPAPPAEPTNEEKLLGEIRDLLKK